MESFRSGDWDDKALFKENCPNSSTGLKIRTERDRHQGNELGNYCHSSALRDEGLAKDLVVKNGFD